MNTTATDKQTEFAELVRAHQADVWRYLRYLGCNESEADDLTQESFLAVYRKPPDLADESKWLAYLRTVARNQFLMARRGSKRQLSQLQLDIADEEWAAAMECGGWESYRSALAACLETALDDDKRRVLNLRYHDRLGWNAIGEQVGLAAEGVKSLLRRARQALRMCIEGKLAREDW